MAPQCTLDNLARILDADTKVKLAGVDVDGVLRGKLVSKKKFLGIAKEGFGFCSVIFGWDMHDQTYFRELAISNAENGYHDIIAIPDLSSFRRIPWEDNVPFFLVSFFDPDTMKPVSVCPRGVLKTAVEKLKEKGIGAMAGGMNSRAHSCRGTYLLTIAPQLSTSSSNSKLHPPILMPHTLRIINPQRRPSCAKIQSMHSLH